MTEHDSRAQPLSEPLSEPPPEPWLRGTLGDLPAVQRAVLHALDLTREDLHRWCAGLHDEEVNARPMGLPSLAFQLRHVARSLDRLLTYAEGHQLHSEQLAALSGEHHPGATITQLLDELDLSLENSAKRIRSFEASALEQARTVGKRRLPTTLGGLLVHVADHTQRHTGQAITTAKLLLAQRAKS
jgi:uncharacterized damage-inducible protein DinB